jgi:large subunit ribosomal protein L11
MTRDSSPPDAPRAIGRGGAGEPHKTKVGRLTAAQVREIAQTKLEDLNANDVEQAAKIIAGTARSMGITVER